MFIGGRSYSIYVYMYSLICPSLIGLGIACLEKKAIKKRNIVFGLTIILAILSFLLLTVGITSDNWIMIIDTGNGLRVLLAAIIVGLLKLR